ncbi:PE family protein [Mycobacterium sp. ML4]
MSQLNVVPDVLKAASGRLQSVGAGLRTANVAAAAQTTAILAPAADEISVAITTLLGNHAQQFQTLSAQTAAYHDNFVSLLNSGAAQYLGCEVANAQQTMANAGAAASTPVDMFINDLTTFSQTSNFGPLQISSSVGVGGVHQSATLNGPLGQVASLSLSAAPVIPSSLSGVAGFAANVTGTVNTALGPVTWMSAGGNVFVSPTGGFTGALYGPTPLGPTAISVSGPVPFMVTGGSVTALGWEFYFHGTQFGFVPLFLQPLGLGV